MDKRDYNTTYKEAQQTLDRLVNSATMFGENRLTSFSEKDEIILKQALENYGVLLDNHNLNEINNLLGTFTDVKEKQVLHNGIFVYGYPSRGVANVYWCHLILLQSKHDLLHQHVAIISQVPGAVSIVNTIEKVATTIVGLMWEDTNGIVEISPSNTTFIEHLGIDCFGHMLTTHHTTDDWDIMNFKWEHKNEEWEAYSPTWKHIKKQEVDNLLKAL